MSNNEKVISKVEYKGKEYHYDQSTIYFDTKFSYYHSPRTGYMAHLLDEEGESAFLTIFWPCEEDVEADNVNWENFEIL